MNKAPMISILFLVFALHGVAMATTNFAHERPEISRMAEDLNINTNEVVSLLESEEASLRIYHEKLSLNPDEAIRDLAALAAGLAGSDDIFKSNTAVARGKVVPEQIYNVSSSMIAGSKKQILIYEVGFMGIPSARFSDQIFLFSASYSIAQSKPNLLIKLLKKRSDSLPPTAGDMLVYQAIQDGVFDNRAVTLHAESSEGSARSMLYDELRSLATARNPVYRFLALSLIPSVAANLEATTESLKLFSSDTDPEIRKRALDGQQSGRVREP